MVNNHKWLFSTLNYKKLFFIYLMYLLISTSVITFPHCVWPSSLSWTPLDFLLIVLLVFRWIHSHDSSLPSEEEDRLLCDPDISALYHDGHPLTGVLLAQSRVSASQNCLWWGFHFNISNSIHIFHRERKQIYPTHGGFEFLQPYHLYMIPNCI